MIVKPPTCSLPSMYGPSVIRHLIPAQIERRRGVGGCRPPEKIQAPAARMSACTAYKSSEIFLSTSGLSEPGY